MGKIQRYLQLKRSQQHDFLYPLIFQEYIYVFAHNRALNRSILSENPGYDNKYSLRIVKRLITRMYRQNHFIIFSNDFNKNPFLVRNNNLYSQIISEGFAFIVEIPFFLQLLSCRLQGKKNNKIVKSQNLRSIHSIFPFLEDNFSHLNFVLDILIPRSVHVEILIQTIRRWVKDVSFLHLLRVFLNEYEYWNSLLTPKKVSFSLSKRNQKLFFFLYNSHVCEYESIFVFLRNQSFHLRSTSSGVLLERIYFSIKIERLVNVFVKDFRENLWLVEEPCMHYIRYQRKSIMASKGTSLFMNKWKFYLVTFWQWHFSVWFGPRRVWINQFSKHSLTILGYLSNVQMNPSVVRSQIIENSFLINNAIKKLDTFVPIISLIAELAKAEFCNVLGHPISKPIRAELSDSNIIDRFARICRNISHYHSGSSKKKSLYRIKYILRLSCARTLARKHKSTVRAFLKRLGSELLEEFLMSEEDILFLTFQKKATSALWGVYRSRIWYLDMISVNDLANTKSQFEDLEKRNFL